jgi:hypothetical protein
MRPSRMLMVILLIASLSGCATSRSAPPTTQALLPRFELSALKGHTVDLTVLDHRAEATDTEQWIARLRADVGAARLRAGTTLAPSGEYHIELCLLQARSDFEFAQWKGCARIAADVTGPGVVPPVAAVADKCVTKSNLWGSSTAGRVLQQAYNDALSELLSSLDHDLR